MTIRSVCTGIIVLVFGIAGASALAGSQTTNFTVISTLDGKTVLPLRIPWIAHPQIALKRVARVDYLIDGQLAWIEQSPPYYYGGNHGHDSNWLVTSFLKPGLHTFTVEALTTTVQSASDAVKARVIAAPAPPAKLAGAWTRMVTAADLKMGPKGPPVGRWTITINKIGWATGPGDDFDVRYLPNGNVVMGLEIDTLNRHSGAFCGVDPLHTWTVALATDDKTVQLNPLGTDSCRDRVAILPGTWTRVH
jgi:hypothetical protein